MRSILFLLLLLGTICSVNAQSALRITPREPDASDAFFEKGMIPELKIEISKEEMEKLKQKDRE
ncbi:MAG TPA: hypothetical protein PKA06_02980, partial [Gemmatales bacterium]|nr:hypothetical protein [Gemmatales bacterium]